MALLGDIYLWYNLSVADTFHAYYNLLTQLLFLSFPQLLLVALAQSLQSDEYAIWTFSQSIYVKNEVLHNSFILKA